MYTLSKSGLAERLLLLGKELKLPCDLLLLFRWYKIFVRDLILAIVTGLEYTDLRRLFRCLRYFLHLWLRWRTLRISGGRYTVERLADLILHLTALDVFVKKKVIEHVAAICTKRLRGLRHISGRREFLDEVCFSLRIFYILALRAIAELRSLWTFYLTLGLLR